MKLTTLISACALAHHAAAIPASEPLDKRAAPTVTFGAGSVKGRSLLGVETFNGIPFAQPPVGGLRLRPPQPFKGKLSGFDASGIPASCPQMVFSSKAGGLLSDLLGNFINHPLIQKAVNIREDCLTVNVQRPAGTKASDKLPVLFWIFGGGFELGATQTYDATSLIASGVATSQPFVFVAVNYRTGGFGFLGGKEILADGASNLGLLDQRLGLEWVADNIAAFGGDPGKVTIWGQSAGAISVFDQMLLYGGNITYKSKPLFRGAIMNSGSVVPTAPVDGKKAQAVYDTVVREGGCSAKADTLACLRGLPYEKFLAAATSVPGLLSYDALALSYLPRPDGVVLPDSPDVLHAQGRYAAVPMIVGDQEDEGTLFALFQPNHTTTQHLKDYLSKYYFHDATKAQVSALVGTYNPSITEGSPFGSGILNNIYPTFKLTAAMLGDLVFTLSRRLALSTSVSLHPDVPVWSYLASYHMGVPVLGSFHGGDIVQVFYGILPNRASNDIRKYYWNFLYNLDPNQEKAGWTWPWTTTLEKWPQWKEGKKLQHFLALDTRTINDDFRQGSYEFIRDNVRSLRF